MSNLDDGILLDLIDHVYAAAVEPARWADVTAALGITFRAQFSLMFGFDSSRSSVLYAELWGLPTEALIPYEKTYAALDIRMPAALSAPAGTVVTDECLIERGVYHSSAIYNEYLRRIDCDHIMGVLPSNSSDMRVIVSLNRSRRVGAFDVQEQEFLQRLVPHIQRAVHMSAKLVNSDSAMHLCRDLMARVHFGVITLTRDGRVVDANPVAEQLLRDGDSLTQISGRLAAVPRIANDRLQSDIATMGRHIFERKYVQAEPLAIQRPAGSPIRVLIAPLAVSSPTLRAVDPVLIVFLFADDAGPAICAATLSRVYGITPAEARITAKLAEGYSLNEIAHGLSISIETVRTHVKRVFAKIPCDSQSALIRTILLGPTQPLSRREQ